MQVFSDQQELTPRRVAETHPATTTSLRATAGRSCSKTSTAMLHVAQSQAIAIVTLPAIIVGK